MQLTFPVSFFCFLSAIFKVGEIIDIASSSTFQSTARAIVSLHSDSFDWWNELSTWLSVYPLDFYFKPVDGLFFIYSSSVNFRRYPFALLILH